MDDVSLSCDDSLHSESLLHGTTTNMVTNMQRLTWLWGDAIDDEEIPNKGSPINTMNNVTPWRLLGYFKAVMGAHERGVASYLFPSFALNSTLRQAKRAFFGLNGDCILGPDGFEEIFGVMALNGCHT
ncbi:hypothetical protein JHK84_043210 [Glycine max]|nr:hypothetical protein JHK84_043210 [Glycine max]